MSALNIYPSFQWTTGQTMTAQLLNNPLAAIQAWSTTIDNTNLTGGAGIFASQIVPLNTAEATFGGAVGYTFAPGNTTQVPITATSAANASVATGIFNMGTTQSGDGLQVNGATSITGNLFAAYLTSGGLKVAVIPASGGVYSTNNAAPTVPAAGGLSTLGALITQGSAGTVSGAVFFGNATKSAEIGWNQNISNQLEVKDTVNTWTPITAGAYTNASDVSLKANIQPVTDALATAMQLKPISFAWRATGLPGLGFSAQDVQLVLPDLVQVIDRESGQLGMNYDGIIPVCVAAIQELAAQFSAYVAAHP